MKQNNSKNRSGWVRMILSVLVVSSGLWSCFPDYKLDKEFPEWLGTSIYETLQEGFDSEDGTKHYSFNYYVRLIDALGQKKVLAKTGSRTLFVADDAAFERFLNKCPLAGNKSVRFEDLSKAQLKMILKGSMLNNVYQVAALSSSPTNDGVRVGDCMRRISTMSEYDSIRILLPKDMPKTEYWNYVRNNSARQTKGILIMEDGTQKPMVFFSNEFLKSHNMIDDDYNFLFNLSEKYGDKTKAGRKTKDASINGIRIETPNKKCYNGFIHVMEDVVYLLPSMAEYLAQNNTSTPDKTSIIWSSIIERFSVPFYTTSDQAYDAEHTGANMSAKVRELLDPDLDYYGRQGARISDALGAGGTDSVFTKLYFSTRYQATLQNKGALTANPVLGGSSFDGKAVLKFDPGWNTFYGSGSDADRAIQEDMGVMFVPTDEAMMYWWLKTTLGKEMRKMYGIRDWEANDPRWTPDTVADDMSRIEYDVISKMVNNHMFSSLTNTVPSKFGDVLNDAQDPYFTPGKIGEAISHFTNVAMCCNGAIYFSNTVFDPTAYKAVSYPSLVNNKLKILNWAIHDNEMAFKYYLLSMETAYCLFLPEVNFVDNDEDISDRLIWVEPSSFMTNKFDPEDEEGDNKDLMALAFYYDDHDKKVKADYYNYDAETNAVVGEKQNTEATIDSITFIRNRMEDFLNYHIVILGNKKYKAMEDGSVKPDANGYAYFYTKGGGAIRFKSTGFVANPENPSLEDYSKLEVAGGWQIETDQSVTVKNRFDMTIQDGNGITYIIDKPIQTSRKSVYDILRDTLVYKEFTEFFKLIDGAKNKDGKSLLSDRYGKSYIGSDRCVNSFNTFNYTVYVPNNSSIKQLLKDTVIYDPAKLDEWDSIYSSVYEVVRYKGNASAVWQDSIKDFFSKRLNRTIANDDPILAFNTTSYDSTGFKTNFLDVKCDELVNFIEYHIQDNSVYTNAEFNTNYGVPADYETAYLRKINGKKQFAKLTVTVGDDITVQDAVGHTRNVLKDWTVDRKGISRPYWNIMCREYVFKGYKDDYSGTNDDEPEKIERTKLETSSYAVIHLIDGALCNGQGKKF